MTSSLKKQILFCTIGSTFEWYEFTIFVSLTPIISQIFFPNNNHFAAMMSTFAVFASGFLMRPVGAFFFGHLGDTIGRKATLLITLFVMAIATTAMGLIPVGASFSTILLVLCRLIQGFACSGEYPGALTLLTEQHNPKHKAFIASFGIFGTLSGSFAGAFIYIMMLKLIGYDAMLHWGWRIVFLLAAPLGMIGYLFRRSISESKEFETLKQQRLLSHSPMLQLLTQHYKTVMAVLCISILSNTIIYLNYIYIGNYALATHKITADEVTYLYLFLTFVTGIAVLFFGFLSDYWNKKLIMLSGCILMVCFAYPLYDIILTGSLILQFMAQALLAILVGVIIGPFSLVLAESFPTEVRCSGVCFTLNFAASLFGGTAPMLCAWLTTVTESTMAPSVYIIFLASVAVGAMFYLISRHDSFRLGYSSAI